MTTAVKPPPTQVMVITSSEWVRAATLQAALKQLHNPKVYLAYTVGPEATLNAFGDIVKPVLLKKVGLMP